MGCGAGLPVQDTFAHFRVPQLSTTPEARGALGGELGVAGRQSAAQYEQKLRESLVNSIKRPDPYQDVDMHALETTSTKQAAPLKSWLAEGFKKTMLLEGDKSRSKEEEKRLMIKRIEALARSLDMVKDRQIDENLWNQMNPKQQARYLKRLERFYAAQAERALPLELQMTLLERTRDQRERLAQEKEEAEEKAARAERAFEAEHGTWWKRKESPLDSRFNSKETFENMKQSPRIGFRDLSPRRRSASKSSADSREKSISPREPDPVEKQKPTPDRILVSGAMGSSAQHVNGLYQLVKEERNGFPAWQKITDKDKWLVRSLGGKWNVINKERMVTGKSGGWLTSSVEDRLPPQITHWKIWIGDSWVYQPSIKLKGKVLSKAQKEKEQLDDWQEAELVKIRGSVRRTGQTERLSKNSSRSRINHGIHNRFKKVLSFDDMGQTGVGAHLL
eukprot:TRINITY_DN35670_c0_g1_i1.p1 TRINITY_DN35670_c0_g1~~TRINITY_DN35670_c0_g1_i1.p1  ORF type:complete len:475 (-),score=99.82 TRINITY_DN35670_c0_g1_i1:50-1393(-)